ncbi:ABC transporter substrate-binding protein (plasmid) [Burkholderia sp. THE68]|uniref:ABC transporter substrate-binding protein n=1 Tax=Burkholderia sp. THE68 TaxID=758782 RepID=UPI001318A077|nr:ABC transporter substrate-binding protein [Burkholderia sp. THE68]BBU32350.1 ABC transporter substrate-binding protein [Burkholderia sp. THE68]
MSKGKSWRRVNAVIATGTVAAGLSLSASAHAAGEPIKIGVISEESAVAGASISKAAQLAAEEINAKGGVDGRQIQIIAYDDHSSASDGVRAFQRAASQDKVVAIIGSYISEVALAMEPWSARLKMPFITPGAASNEISKRVHDDYNNYKYTFHGWMTSAFIAQSICDFSHDVLVGEFKMKTTVVMSEDAAWTKPLDERYLECLPKAGLKVLDHIRFNPDTSDFTPIFNQIEAKHPDTITTGISHVGVQPTVQWHDQQVPIPMSGQSSQATTTSFWKDTNGATEGVITASAAAPGVAMTPKTVPFVESYQKHFAGVSPAYDGFTSYDLVYIIADAIHRNQGSTDPDMMVDALEKTDYVGTIGRWQFYGKNDQFTHALKYGEGYITGINLQWQNGRQVAIWPKSVANGKVKFPAFVKVQAAAN